MAGGMTAAQVAMLNEILQGVQAAVWLGALSLREAAVVLLAALEYLASQGVDVKALGSKAT